tara:strand:+ start:129 stop:404 length:276 start_codon:yes stop_codon:yes gene_type:complete
MKKPEKIKILGQWAKVQYVDLTKGGEAVGEVLYGDCDVATRTIRIEKSLDDNLTKRVIKHETMHMKLGLSGLSEILTDEQEEAICVLVESD